MGVFQAVRQLQRVYAILLASLIAFATSADDGHDAWAKLIEAGRTCVAVDYAWRNRPDLPENWYGSIDYQIAGAQSQQEKELYDELFAELRNAGVFEDARPALANPSIERPAASGAGMFQTARESEPLRTLAMTQMIGIFVAARNDRDEEMIHLLRDQLRLAQVCSQQSYGLIDRTMALAIRQLSIGTITDLLLEGEIDLNSATEILAAIEDHPLAILQETLDAERSFQKQVIDYLYDDEARDDGMTTDELLRELTIAIARTGDLMRTLLGLPEVDDPRRVDEAAVAEALEDITFATREEMHAMVDQQIDALLDDVDLEPWRRRIDREAARDISHELFPEYVLLCDAVPAIQKMIDSSEQIETFENAVEIMLLLELHRAEHGEYPESLRELAAERGEPIAIIDTYFGTPLGYRRVEGDPHGRGYLLYSFGADGADNGGRPAAPNAWEAFSEEGAGSDWVFNVPAAQR